MFLTEVSILVKITRERNTSKHKQLIREALAKSQ